MKRLALVLSFTLLGALSAQAEPRMIERFNDWGVYSYESGDGTACYLLTVPKTKAPANVDHGDNFFLIAPGNNRIKYEPQAKMGYDLKPGSRLKVQIGDQTFWMVVKDRTAWVQKEDREPEMISAMRGGSEMILEATSRRGTETTYTYSLDGVTAALKRVSRCN